MRRILSALWGLIRRIGGRFWRFFELDRRALWRAAAAFVVASVAGGAIGYRGYVWVWIAPEFCYVCHIHDYAVEDWRRSIHGDIVTCHDCHRVPLLHYTKTFVHTFIQRPDYPEDLEEMPHISSETCESCHLTEAAAFHELSSPMPRWVFDGTVRVDDSPAHRIHMEATSRDPGGERGGAGESEHREHKLDQHGADAHSVGYGTGLIDCIDCHGTEINRYHNFLARAENCQVCHADLSLRGEHLSDFDCKHCHFHEFLAPRDLTQGSVGAMALPTMPSGARP